MQCRLQENLQPEPGTKVGKTCLNSVEICASMTENPHLPFRSTPAMQRLDSFQ